MAIQILTYNELWALIKEQQSTETAAGYTDGPKKYTHFNVQNICLNNSLVYLRFNFQIVRT
jgi:hypothetical protein